MYIVERFYYLKLASIKKLIDDKKPNFINPDDLTDILEREFEPDVDNA